MAAPNLLNGILSDVSFPKDFQGKDRFKCKMSWQCDDGSKVNVEVKPPSKAPRLPSFVKKRVKSKEIGDDDDSARDPRPSSATPPPLPPRPYDVYELPEYMHDMQQRPWYSNLPAIEERVSDTSGEPNLSTGCYLEEPDRPQKEEEEEEDLYNQESTETYIKLKRQSEINRLSKTIEGPKGLSNKEVIPSQGDKKGADYVGRITFV